MSACCSPGSPSPGSPSWSTSLLSSPDKRGAALKQGLIPLIGVVLVALGL